MKNNFNISCPEFTNPADFLLDIACNKKPEGLEIIEKMTNFEQDKFEREKFRFDKKGNRLGKSYFMDPICETSVKLKEINRSSFKQKQRFFNEFFTIHFRFVLCYVRDMQQFLFRTFANLFFPFVLFCIMQDSFGGEKGCTFKVLNETHYVPENSYDYFSRKLIGIQNASAVFINIMFLLFMSMIPATLFLSQHISLLKKEYLNSYYKINTFFFATIATSVLFTLLYSICNAASFFYFSKFDFEIYKFISFWFIVFISSIIGEMVGICLSICFPGQDKTIVALTVSVLVAIQIHIFSGFIVYVDVMKDYIRSLSWFIFCRHSILAAIKILYNRRCQVDDFRIFGFDSLIDFVHHYNIGKSKKIEYINNMSLKSRQALKNYPWNRTSVSRLYFFFQIINFKFYSTFFLDNGRYYCYK